MNRVSACLILSAFLLSTGVSAADGKADWSKRIGQLAKPAADELVLTAVGDSIWNRPISGSADPAQQSLFEILRGGDIGFFNFEQGIVPDKGFPVNGAPAAADRSILQEFKWAGATMVSVGNNHQWDYGQPGLELTRRTIEAAGIKAAGTGADIAEAFKAAQFEKKGLKVALISAVVSNATTFHPATADSPGVAQIRGVETRRADGSVMLSPVDSDLKALEASIKEARKSADLVAVSLHFHWGDAEAVDPGGRQLITHAVIDAGGDLVLGHGPHVVNGIEFYKKKPIVYSLGNFVFQQFLPEYRFFPDSVKILTPMLADPKTHEAIALRLILSSKGEVRRMELVPLDINTEGTPRLTADQGVLDRVASLSRPLGTTVKKEGWYYVVELQK